MALRVASWDCLDGLSHFLPPQATGQGRVLIASVQCGGEEKAPKGVKCLSWLGMGEETRDCMVTDLGP